MSKKLTPFQQRGWTEDMLFEVTNDGPFTVGSAVTLFEDGGGYRPLFKLVVGSCEYDNAGGEAGAFTYLDDLKPIGYITDKCSDKSFVSTGGVYTIAGGVALPEGENVSEIPTGSEKGIDTHYLKHYKLTESDIENGFVRVDPYFVGMLYNVGERDSTGAFNRILKAVMRDKKGNSFEREVKAIYSAITRLAYLNNIDLEGGE